MTNFQLYLAVGLPIVAVLASLVISLFQISGVREDARRALINSRFDSVERRLELI